MIFYLREAHIGDARKIAEVHVRTWQDAYKSWMPEDFLANLSIDQREDKWRTILKNPEEQKRNFVAELDGKIFGGSS